MATQFDAQIVPGKVDPKDPGQINVLDAAGNIVANPSTFFTQDNPNTATNESMSLADRTATQTMDPTVGTVDGSQSWAQLNPTSAATQAYAQPVSGVDPKTAQGYDVSLATPGVTNAAMTAAQGTVSDQSQVTAAQADMQGLSTGVNADGSVNYAGQALKNFATQNMTNVVDTSTQEGKTLAAQLGEGNYLDSKATVKGQLEALNSEFFDPKTGEPKIPSWASGAARNVSKIAAFKGMSGTAAATAMSQALLEASIPIAQQDAQFFQTLTLQNLTNKQQSIINTANVLSKFEQTNVDNRMAAAIQNAKSFLEMDLANLSNEQQSRVINTQARVQALLEDSKQVNLRNNFVAQSQNDMDKFYDQLNAQIAQYNSTQGFDASKFNATMADSREKFYSEMQYNINTFNAAWRQKVEIQDDQQQFEAAATDTKNMFDISTNQLNQIWDRSDALLDYAWKSAESAKQRKAQMSLAILQGKIQSDLADKEGLGSLVGLAAADILKGTGSGGSSILNLFGF